MYCPNCKKTRNYEGARFCLECGSPLIDDPVDEQQGFSVNLGRANAISGGVNLNDSHNVSNVDQRVINTNTVSNVTNNITQLERQKTDTEILQESKIQYMTLCRQVYADGILEEHEKAMLEVKRIELNLDERTAAQLLESARRSMNSRMTALTVKDSVTMKLINKLVSEDKADLVKAQLPRLEAMARMYQVDEVLYNYNMLLAALNPDKLIQQYEGQPTDEYWQTFWVCLAYLKRNDIEKFEEASLRLNLYPNYSENNDLILQAISICHDFGADSDTVQEVMSIIDESSCSPELKSVIHALYLVADPEKAEEVKASRKACAFLMENVVSLESPEARAERLAKERAEAEAKAREEAAEAARLKAESEAKARAAAEAKARAKAEQEAMLRRQITYSVYIKKVDNQILAMMTVRGALGWSSANSRTNFAKLPFLAKQTDNQAEAKTLTEKLSKGGMTVSLEAVNGMGEKVDANAKAVADDKSKEAETQQKPKKYLDIHNVNTSKTVATDDTVFQIVKDEIKRLGTSADLNDIDVSRCTTFFDVESDEGLFQDTDFQGDISKWDVSNITSMNGMFKGCKNFNGDLSQWNVSNVENMKGMFCGCENFNQDLSSWNVSNVKDMSDMFSECKKFNGDLSEWDVSNVINMDGMFFKCSKFNGDLSQWDVSNVENMKAMFMYCENFNQDLSSWDVSSVETMAMLFYSCHKFNQDISMWDVSNVENMYHMFDGCAKFNCDLSEWDVSNVKDMAGMFSDCYHFNQDLSRWNVSNVIDTLLMFSDCGMDEDKKPKFK